MSAGSGREGAVAGLSTFGLLLTGRLALRNELLSALSVGTKTPFGSRQEQREHEVWDERYFVLTRKALHYYVRAHGRQQLGSGRDMFGKHEGSVPITSIASIEEDRSARELTLVTKGPGRNYVLRARSQASYDRWCSTLNGATLNLYGSTDRVFSTSSSFHHIPSLLDFHVPPPPPPRTDNVAYICLASHKLGLSALIERGLPWGVPLRLALGRPFCLDTARDSLTIALEGGGSATLLLSNTLDRYPSGSEVIEVHPPVLLHTHVRVNWKPDHGLPSRVGRAGQQASRVAAPSAVSQAASLRYRIFALIPRTTLRAAFAVGATAAALWMGRTPTPTTGSSRPVAASAIRRRFVMAAGAPNGDDSTFLFMLATAEEIITRLRQTLMAPLPTIAPPSLPRPALLPVTLSLLPLLVVAAALLLALSFSLRCLRLRATRLHRRFRRVQHQWILEITPSNAVEAEEASRVRRGLAPSDAASAPASLGGSPVYGSSPTGRVPSFARSPSGISPVQLPSAGVQRAVRTPLPPRLVAEEPSSADATLLRRGFESAAAAPRIGSNSAEEEADLRMDAVLADICSAENSILYEASMQFRAAMKTAEPTNAGTASPSRGAASLQVTASTDKSSVVADASLLGLEPTLQALEAGVIRINQALGLSLLVRNDETNLRKVREAAAAANEAGLPSHRVSQILEAEVRTGIHKLGDAYSLPPVSATLADPSAAVALLWMRRGLHLTIALASGILAMNGEVDVRSLPNDTDDAASVHLALKGSASPPLHRGRRIASGAYAAGRPPESSGEVLRQAYAESLEPYHSWLLRQTFSVFCSAAPSYDNLLRFLSPGLGDVEREAVVLNDLRIFVAEARPFLKALEKLFAEQGLEDTRKI